MHARLVAATTLILLTTAGTGAASTAKIVVRDDDGELYYTADYAAAPGEANQVDFVFAKNNQSVTITDTGATITAGKDCAATDAHTVKCTIKFPKHSDFEQFYDAHAALGDMDDTISITSEYDGARFEGGPGNDTIHGNQDGRGDILDGGPGADHIFGTYNSTLIEGDDDGATSPDVLDGGTGGSGGAILSYEHRSGPITIDLTAGTSGAEGEGDTFTNIGGAVGGSSDDTLIAGQSTTFLQGGDGDDTFDTTGAKQGGDMYNDTIDVFGDGGRDTYKCGHGVFEYIHEPDVGERIPPGCNIVTGHGWSVKPLPVSHTAAAVKYTLPCPDGNDDGLYLPCTAKLTLTQKGKLVGQAGYTLARDAGMKPLTVPLTALGAKLLKQPKLVTATLTSTTNHGKSGTLRWSFRLGDVRD